MFSTVTLPFDAVQHDAFESDLWVPGTYAAVPEPTDEDLEAMRADLATAEAEAELDAQLATEHRFIAEHEAQRAIGDLARRYGRDAVLGVLGRAGFTPAA